MIGTPIGNLGDLAPRARETLQSLDVLFCEDTRVTGRLLDALGIQTKTRSLHDDSPQGHWRLAIREAQQGRAIGFVADAGMPGVSDPGRKLLRLAWDLDVPVKVVPGPSSVGALLACCPFAAGGFVFSGFAPRSDGELQKFAAGLAVSEMPSFFFDSPRRVHKTLEILHIVLEPERELLLGREMTKVHEQLVLFKAGAWQAVKPGIPELGEFTIAVEGIERAPQAEDAELIEKLAALQQAGFTGKQAATALSVALDLPPNRLKRLVYRE